MSVLIARAKWLARLVHEDETRRNGDPYISHCDEVEEALEKDGEDENTRCAGEMHDIFENAKNPDLIRAVATEYFPYEVVFLIETVTHDKNIYYSRYIDVVSNNPKALKIKYKDMISNTKDENLPEKQLIKYREACIQMIAKGKDVPKILRERLKIEDKDNGSEVLKV